MTLQTTLQATGNGKSATEILNAIAPRGHHSPKRKLRRMGAMRFTELPDGDLTFNMKSDEWDGVRITPHQDGNGYTMKLWCAYRIPAALGAIGKGAGTPARVNQEKGERSGKSENGDGYRETEIHAGSLKELHTQFQDIFLETRFHALAAIWKEQTKGMSPPQMAEHCHQVAEHRYRSTKKTAGDHSDHHAYREILGMKERAVPLILRDLRDNGGHWFHALHIMTGAQPVRREDRGRAPKMAQAWLEWGRANGHIS